VDRKDEIRRRWEAAKRGPLVTPEDGGFSSNAHADVGYLLEELKKYERLLRLFVRIQPYSGRSRGMTDLAKKAREALATEDS